MKLVITEKPSVAMSVSKVIGATQRSDGYMEGSGYLVSWCIGHLVELSEPQAYDERYGKWSYNDLPILPERWKYQITPATKKQFGILKKLMERSDVESIVCATDAGREGELIYHQCGCQKPFERLWISSMEDSAIREGFANLRPGAEYNALYEAALCRERADWIVGINGTRLFSCLYGQTLNVGRVMTPTLAMVVMRDAAIRGFQSESFYTVELRMEGFRADGERMKEKAEAEKQATLCRQEAQAIVTKITQKERTEKPPTLYDLTSLQRDANRQLGFTAQQTLDYTQALYEKKLVTYPRTDSRYLTEDMAEGLPELVQGIQRTFHLQENSPASMNTAQVINRKKVTDHHAIIPTKTAVAFDISSLPAGEQAILKLISMRLVCAVGMPCRYTETSVELECAGYPFYVKGKTVLDAGWKQYTGKSDEDSDKNDMLQKIPVLSEQMILPLAGAELKAGKTSPPKRFTEDSLLAAMESAGAGDMPDEAERKGIGTPATRAGIIEKLVAKGYLERKGDKKTKYLAATDKGSALVTVIPEQIQSPVMTAEWEQKLLEIERGEYDSGSFMEEISGMISDLVKNYEAVKGANVFMRPDGKIIGTCPACGGEVMERAKGWFCTSKSCKFALWKDNNYFKKIGKTMTPGIAEQLVKKGQVKLKGCHSQETYDAILVMKADSDGRAVFSMCFENGGTK